MAENRSNPFIGLDQHPDRNHGRAVVLLHDPWSSPYQSPVGPGYGIGFGIGTWIGAIDDTPEYFCGYTHAKVFAFNVPPPSLLVYALCTRCHWIRARESLWGTDRVGYWNIARKK